MRLRPRLARTRAAFAGVFAKRGRIDDATWDDLEEALLLADVGVSVTARLLEALPARAAEANADTRNLAELVASEICGLLEAGAADRTLHRSNDGVTVWLLVGVNGSGKTTTAAKLGAHELAEGRRVLLAAADTFRAAAGEQLAVWAERIGAELVRGQEGGDPGAVVFDAVSAATKRGADTVVVDTAGRLHTKANLMAELGKVRRVAERFPGAPHEVLLVLDATTGQNAIAQAREFTGAVGVTGLVLTKLDGTAKGGVVLAVEADLGVPVKLVGIGEDVADLVAFDPAEFAAALVE